MACAEVPLDAEPDPTVPTHPSTIPVTSTTSSSGSTTTQSTSTTTVPLPLDVLPVMIDIPSLTFTRGSDEPLTDILEQTAHDVTVSAFRLAMFEFTFRQWEGLEPYAISLGYTFESTVYMGGQAPQSPRVSDENHPAVGITWRDAVLICNAMSELAGLTPVYYTDDTHTSVLREVVSDVPPSHVNWSADGYRLPTEAEWQAGAAGGATTTFPWGDDISCANANYLCHSNPEATGSTEVGAYPPNGYGLYDVAGNAREWTWDWLGLYTADPKTDPRGPASPNEAFLPGRVVRGGTWGSYTGLRVRLEARAFEAPSSTIGATTIRFAQSQ